VDSIAAMHLEENFRKKGKKVNQPRSAYFITNEILLSIREYVSVLNTIFCNHNAAFDLVLIGK